MIHDDIYYFDNGGAVKTEEKSHLVTKATTFLNLYK